MTANTFFLFIFLAIISACSKNSNKYIYSGEVIRQSNYCTSGKGFPFIIKFINKQSNTDSLITITLPTQYKIIGKKIKFEMRNLTSNDEYLACVDLFGIPKQAVIFNVSQ